MLSVQLKVSGKAIITAQGETQADVFGQLASMQEIFGQQKCGKCQCEELRFVVREVEGNSFYELRCTNPKCRAMLTFGQNKEAAKKGQLFPHIKENKKKTIMGGRLKEGDYLPDGGWLIFDKKLEEANPGQGRR